MNKYSNSAHTAHFDNNDNEKIPHITIDKEKDKNDSLSSSKPRSIEDDKGFGNVVVTKKDSNKNEDLKNKEE